MKGPRTEPLFYSERLADPGGTVMLTGDEARHAVAARRLKPGDTLWLFDGNGGLARTTLLAAGRNRGLELRVEDRRSGLPPRPALELACALPKGDRQNVLLDMATQLGMTRFTPLACARGVAAPGANSAARWRKICLEACKQSRRLHLPVIDAPVPVPEAVARAVARGGRVWLAHPGEGAESAKDAVDRSPGDVTLLIGPEGGFTPEEISEGVARGAGVLGFGEPVLRIETAAVALVALFAAGGARPRR